MKKIFLFFMMCTLLFGGNALMAQSTMTDAQVLEYVKTGLAQGKSQKTLMTELVARGVDRAQAERVKELYEKRHGGEEAEAAQESAMARSRDHRPNGESAQELDSYVADDIIETEDAALPSATDDVFGRSTFRNKRLNFAPSANMPTPKNYVLGPGDEVIIDIYGANQTTIRRTISPEGQINVDALGPVYLSGKSIDDANRYLKQKLSTIYNGLNGDEEQETDIQLSLGQIRSIQVNMLGDVANPGTYMISSLSTVFHALYQAGGVKEPGTIRAIKVVRNNKTISTIDVYDFLINGNRKGDIRLEEGDVVLVDPYKNLVKVNGYVKRPMNFEMKENETLKDLIKYAGGFSKAANQASVTVVRQTDRDYQVHSVDASQYATFVLKNGDEIEVNKLEARFQNRATIKGAVYQAGLYEISTKVYSVKTLINAAQGLLPEAFTNRAVLHREREDRSLEVVSVNINGILDGSVPDIILKNNDQLYIPSKYDLIDKGTIAIRGEVAVPDIFPYAENTTLEDLIVMAGGLKAGASLARVDVIRRIHDVSSTEVSKEIAKMFSFSVKEGFVIDGTPGFILEPYDEVVVRRAPSYINQRYVTVSGEAVFTGSFPMTERNERISELVKKAGGVTNDAYLKGARLVRQINATERKQMQDALMALRQQDDTASMRKLNMATEYYVGIDLEKALDKPNSEYDVVLREGDRLEIPTYSNVVRITGAVQYPNSVTYLAGKKAKYYIEQAGGYADRARKSRAYVIHMNGHITKAKRGDIDPGSEIVVPSKKVDPLGLQGYLSIATTSASLATMIASIANILK